MGKKQLSPEQQVTRWEHIREIENIMGKHTYYWIYCWSEKEWEDLWCKKAPDPCMGFNNGYYKGYEAIAGYYKACHDLMELRTKLVKEANPEEFGDKTVEEIFGVGSLDVDNMTTPVIELADDMKTAKGLWYYMRGNTNYEANGINTDHQWGWVGVDFVYEDGAWKIWHLFVGTDFAVPAGQDLKGDTPLEIERKIAAGEMEKPVHPAAQTKDPAFIPMDAYSLKYNYSFYPPLPEPYYSFDECTSNGPEGNPNYKKEG